MRGLNRARLSIRARLAIAAVAAVFIFVAYQGIQALFVLERVERARDTWQRPDDIISALDLKPGDVAVDLGSGSGYFTLRLAPVVGSTGRVVAVDILRQPLAFLWIRRTLRRQWQVDVVLANEHDTRLGAASVDAVLIANTYHELADPAHALSQLRESLKRGGRLVVADRRSRRPASPETDRANHRLSSEVADDQTRAAGFERISRDDSFIDRPGDEPGG